MNNQIDPPGNVKYAFEKKDFLRGLKIVGGLGLFITGFIGKEIFREIKNLTKYSVSNIESRYGYSLNNCLPYIPALNTLERLIQ